MSMTVDQIYKEVIQLPRESRVSLIDRLVEFVGQETDGDLERINLDTAKRRRDEVRSGKAQTLEGNEVLARVRRLVEGCDMSFIRKHPKNMKMRQNII